MIGATRLGRISLKMIRAVRGANRPGRLDELLLAQGEHLPADDPRHVGPAGEGDHEDHHAEAGLDQAAEAAGAAERAGGGEAAREQQIRDRQEHVDASETRSCRSTPRK